MPPLGPRREKGKAGDMKGRKKGGTREGIRGEERQGCGYGAGWLGGDAQGRLARRDVKFAGEE